MHGIPFYSQDCLREYSVIEIPRNIYRGMYLLYYKQEKLFELTLFTTTFYLLSASLNTDGSYVWYYKNYLVNMTTRLVNL